MRRERAKIEIVGTTALMTLQKLGQINKATTDGKSVIINNNMTTTLDNWTSAFGKSFLKYQKGE